MYKISKRALLEIQMEAREYIYSLRGTETTHQDIIAAENLMVFGYIKAIGELNSCKEIRKRCKFPGHDRLKNKTVKSISGAYVVAEEN